MNRTRNSYFVHRAEGEPRGYRGRWRWSGARGGRQLTVANVLAYPTVEGWKPPAAEGRGSDSSAAQPDAGTSLSGLFFIKILFRACCERREPRSPGESPRWRCHTARNASFSSLAGIYALVRLFIKKKKNKNKKDCFLHNADVTYC